MSNVEAQDSKIREETHPSCAFRQQSDRLPVRGGILIGQFELCRFGLNGKTRSEISPAWVRNNNWTAYSITSISTVKPRSKISPDRGE